MRESKRSSTGVTTCWTAILKPIDFMKKCAEHLQHYINCYTYNTIIPDKLCDALHMLHAIRCATDHDRGPLLQGWYILAWYNGSGVSEQVHSMLHIPCYLPTDRLVYRLSLAALRTASVDCTK